jgi:hypothetical protein
MRTPLIGSRDVFSTKPLIEVRTWSGPELVPSPRGVRTLTLPVSAPNGTTTSTVLHSPR